MSEQIVTGKKYKILADATNKVWHVISFISQAVDVFFSNGNNAQTTLGSITGISDSLTSTSSNVAASAASVKALNDKITEISSDLNKELKIITDFQLTTSGYTFTKDYPFVFINHGGTGNSIYYNSTLITTDTDNIEFIRFSSDMGAILLNIKAGDTVAMKSGTGWIRIADYE